MPKDRYWAIRTLDILEKKIDRSRAAMSARLGAPIKRRPNTSALIQESMMQPEGLPPQGREALMRYAEQFYGKEVARTLMAPYILGEPEPLPEEAI